jgi:AcrR family transcriptional regulator
MKSERQQLRRNEILQIAVALFRVRGYHGTRMDDIADTAQVNKATVYYYYASKADLLYDIYLKATSETLDLLKQRDKGLSPAQALLRHTELQLALIASDPDQAAVYFQESPFLDEWLSAEQVTEIRAREKEYADDIREILTQGVEDGTFVVDNPAWTSAAYIGMTSWFYRWYDPTRSGEPQKIASVLGRLFLRGILRDPKEAERLLT